MTLDEYMDIGGIPTILKLTELMAEEKKQYVMNLEAQMKQQALHDQLYPRATLKEPDGSYVYLFADGSKVPIPEYVDYGDDDV